ncbi:hypothetical protein LOTGIDRAFT_142374 [Lottia gigantea]|uniref:Cytochrome P450 n=1 Tax=Lottia gigantea TaxID=225164 RepID=V4AVG4_LOTGI|nr:hypothetical protein LOTGIDRAFT_142374 [Lottia gigantea]ESO99015.1 hypothetical protein LOTGIDRAFT_142374 [Lottia gigantea]
MFTILIGLCVLIIIGYILSKRELPGIPPGPNFKPFLGNFLDSNWTYHKRRHIYFEELRKQYGPVYRIYFGRQLLIVLSDMESINEALVKQKELFSDRPTDKLWDTNEAAKEGTGIVWSNGQNWQNVRRMALQALRDLGVGKATIEERILDETEYILKEFAKSENQPLRLNEIMMKGTSNIISSVVFGSRFENDDPEFTKIVSFMKIAFDGDGPYTPLNVISQLRFLPFVASKLNEIVTVIGEIKAYITNTITEHKETLSKENPRDFIDVGLTSMDESKTLTKGVFMATILDLFLAGSDTTANTLDWAFLYLILHPEIQRKCQQEIDEIVGSGRTVKWADRHKMVYTEATLLEVQRISTIANTTLPHTTTKDSKIQGYHIPKGCLVVADIRAVHLDEKLWENPKQFNPERFLDEDGKIVKSNNLIPFSVGPRACPGASLARMELFLIFTNILQRYTLSRIDESEMELEGVLGITLSPKPYHLLAKSRSS